MLARIDVDLGAIRRNIATLRRVAAPARVCAVVKANAYGHGLIPVARAAAEVADRLAVYSLEEALALREAGIDAELHVLGPVLASNLDAAHAAAVQLTLWDTGLYARQVASIARRRRARTRVQAKIDTGVTRLGVAANDAPAALARWLDTPELDVAGVFSHLAAAEELEGAFTREQLERFNRATAGIDGRIERHIAASAAALLYEETRLDLVRCGIAIYGIWPSPDVERAMLARDVRLVPALRWQTEIALVHDVPEGTAVGYGCTFVTRRPSRIGVLPIGYAEGIPRIAGGRAQVAVAGRRVPLIGRVCMDMAFIDVTDVPGANAGTTVTLIGTDGAASIRAEDWGEWSSSIGYEVVARLPSEIPREHH